MTEGRGRSLVDEGGADKTMLLGVESGATRRSRASGV